MVYEVVDLVVSGGDVLTADGVQSGLWLAAADGRVVAIGDARSVHPPQSREALDAKGMLILPGLVDTHVHFREPGIEYKEGFATGSRAAATGGVTTVFDMPNTEPPTDSPERLREKAARAAKSSWVDFALYGLLGPGRPQGISEMVDAGSIGLKTFLGQSETGPGCPLPPSDGELIDALEDLATAGGRLAVHAENHCAILHRRSSLRKASRIDLAAHRASRPPVLEAEAVMRVGLFAKYAGCPIHIVHVSSQQGLESVARLKDMGVLVTAETCPHYLVPPPGSQNRLSTRVNPPIRGTEDARALAAGLVTGVLDYIASDHAPHRPDEKAGSDMESVRAGLVGVEHMLPVLWSNREQLGITDRQLVHWLTRAPAQSWNVWPQKGDIRIGGDADLLLLDPYKEWDLDGGHSRYPTSPYQNVRCVGKVDTTILGGKIIFRDGHLVGEPQGKWIQSSRAARADKERQYV